jgi:microcystin-dependent protein
VALNGATTAVTQSSGDSTTKVATTQFVTTGLQAAYPVGSIYMSTVSTNPATLFGFGTWVAYGTGRMPISADGSTYVAGATGGSATTTIATTNLPSHTHTFSATSGGMSANSTHSHYVGSRDSTADNGGNYAQEFVSNAGSGYGPNTYTNTVDLSHTHDVSGTTGSAGSGTAVATISPYIAVYMWNRTA